MNIDSILALRFGIPLDEAFNLIINHKYIELVFTAILYGRWENFINIVTFYGFLIT